MTFATDLVRDQFHRLPTETQRHYSEMEKTLADWGKHCRIESVQAFADELEVLVRISEKLEPAVAVS